jgi:F0F1-type ATP synthase membrane subunit c/vacuolar-type H+-ATPase subunit K
MCEWTYMYGLILVMCEWTYMYGLILVMCEGTYMYGLILVMCEGTYMYGLIPDVVSEWLLFNIKRAIFQLYCGENKLYFDEMMMMSALY